MGSLLASGLLEIRVLHKHMAYKMSYTNTLGVPNPLKLLISVWSKISFLIPTARDVGECAMRET